MIELFADLPIGVKKETAQLIDNIFKNYDIERAAEFIYEIAHNCESQEIQDFIDFYFNLKMEQLKNEDDSN